MPRHVGGAGLSTTIDRLPVWLAGIAWVAAVSVLWASRAWPISHDASLMFYVAQEMAHGAVPYRDIMDMNMPGGYLVSLLVLQVAGWSDVAWRAVDLATLAAICLAAGVLVWPVSRVTALSVAAWIALQHVIEGPYLAGQRDFLMIAPVLIGAALLLRATTADDSRRTYWMALGGFMMALGIVLKPIAVLLVAASALWVAAGGGRRAWREALWFLIGASVPVIAMALWLAALGALGPFLELQLKFVLPIYSKVSSPMPPYARMWLIAIGLAGLPIMAASRHRRRYGLLLVLVVYGAVHFHIQRKYWPYQAGPLVAFAFCAAGVGASMWVEFLEHRTPAFARVARLAVPLAVCVWCLVFYGLRPAVRASLFSPAQLTHPFVDRLIEDLSALPVPTTVVQPLDTTFGAVHAMTITGRRPATRMMYSFPLYLDLENGRTPYLDGVRSQFLQDLERAGFPPLIRTSQQWPFEHGYDRLEAWPEFGAMLERRYTLVAEQFFPDHVGYRIYVARDR